MRVTLSTQPFFRALLELEYPLRRPENSYRVCAGRADIRNHFIPDRHEQLNESATFILELCDGRHSTLDIWRRTLEEFDVDDSDEALCSTVRLIRYLQRTYVLYPCTVKDEQSSDPAIRPDDGQTAIRM